jgi:3-dehydroquinate synthase
MVTKSQFLNIIPVYLKNRDRSYNIVVGIDILNQLGTEVKKLNPGESIFILTDSNVGKLYSNQIIESFRIAGFSDIDKFEIKAGEKSKSLKISESVLTHLYKFDKYQQKKIVIINLGGGVVGDLGGFVAGIYRRGVNYIQIPTTLLSQVDSGLGGKVGVNVPLGKNLLGLFYQPCLVYIDLKVLRTLPLRELKSGLAEVIKYGVIIDGALFQYLEKNYRRILNYDYGSIKHIVLKSLKIKSKIVTQDEKDTKDIRIKLNYGHTIGHAIESATGYNQYLHGEAISIGMICASEISFKLGLINENDVKRIKNLIEEVGLPTKIRKCRIEKIMNSMKRDKKFKSGKNRFVLPVKIGAVIVKEDINENLIREVIASHIC